MKIPTNYDLESSVLGSLVMDEQNYPEIQELFHTGLFYKTENRTICEAIIDLKNQSKGIDFISITQWLQSKGLLEKAGGAYNVSTLTSGTIYLTPEKLKTQILLLNQYYVRREFILSNSALINNASEETCDIFDLIGEQEKTLNAVINKISVSKTFDAMDCHLELIKHLDKIEGVREGELIGVDTGFWKLNSVTSGWQKTDLIILAARPGMGKTSFILRNAIAAVTAKKPTLIFSLEMSKLQLYARMCSIISSVGSVKFLKVKMEASERAIFNQTCYDLANSPLYIEDKGGLDVNAIKTKARKLKRDKGTELIIIDYLQFISKEKSNRSTNDQVGEITGNLKALAKELEVPIILLSQLSRKVEERGDKRPMLSDLRDSGSIEQDADMVMFIYRPDYYGIKDDGMGNSTEGKAEIIIAKHRNGGLDNVFLGFDGSCTNFYDIPY